MKDSPQHTSQNLTPILMPVCICWLLACPYYRIEHIDWNSFVIVTWPSNASRDVWFCRHRHALCILTCFQLCKLFSCHFGVQSLVLGLEQEQKYCKHDKAKATVEQLNICEVLWGRVRRKNWRSGVGRAWMEGWWSGTICAALVVWYKVQGQRCLKALGKKN